MTLVIATSSAHKLAEIRALLHEIPNLTLLSLRDFPPIAEPDETGQTMRDNAHLKAQFYAAHTNLPTLADDSGIEIDFLNGAPGVHSARWIAGSDADRTRRVLEKLANVPQSERGTRYRCVLCWCEPNAPASTCREWEATCEGQIATQARGENGFGYDPIFEITDQTGAPDFIGQTMAQVGPEIKAQVSHRARAVRQMAQSLKAS